MTEQDEIATSSVEPPLPRFDALRVVVSILLVLVLLATGAQALFLATYVRSQAEVVTCTQRQLDALTEWANAVASAARSDRQAQRELLLAQAGGSSDQRLALERYLDQLDEADRTRSQNPVPTQRCAP